MKNRSNASSTGVTEDLPIAQTERNIVTCIPVINLTTVKFADVTKATPIRAHYGSTWKFTEKLRRCRKITILTTIAAATMNLYQVLSTLSQCILQRLRIRCRLLQAQPYLFIPTLVYQTHIRLSSVNGMFVKVLLGCLRPLVMNIHL